MGQRKEFSPEEADALVKEFVDDGTLTLSWDESTLTGIWRFRVTTSGGDRTAPFPMQVLNDQLTGHIYDYGSEGSTLTKEITEAINRYAYALLDVRTAPLK